MTEEEALLAAINAAPGDDQPRLVYADWLQEYGDDPNRAELIRIQCGLERKVDWYSGYEVKGERLAELKAREQKLIKQMLALPEAGKPLGIRELTPEMAAIVAAAPHRIIFNRGKIDYLNLSGTPITALPSGLHVDGNLNLNNTPITALPSGLHVGGDLGISGTSITSLPSGLHVGGDLVLAYPPITALPSGLHVGGTLYLINTPITALPSDLHVEGRLFLNNTPITPDAARQILAMPNLSREAKISGLESAWYPNLADEAHRLPETNTGPGTPPRP